MKVQEFLNQLNQWVPFDLQESYDNVGHLVGHPNDDIKGVVVNLDPTEKALDECINQGANVLLTHHPLIFNGLKKIVHGHWISNVIIKAIKNNINIINLHTNLDNVNYGVNKKISEKLGLQNISLLKPKSNQLLKLQVYVPESHLEAVRQVLFNSGAGQIGEYTECSFAVQGKGSFKPGIHANPFVGETNGDLENVKEYKLEVVLPKNLKHIIVQNLLATHPYEEPAYDLIALENSNAQIGSGMVGELPIPITYEDFIKKVKIQFKVKAVKTTPAISQMISKVAFCGGSGSFLLDDSIAQKADVFLSADFKYHDYFEALNRIGIVDIGHFETEQYTSELIFEFLSKKSFNFAVVLGNTITNPINII